MRQVWVTSYPYREGMNLISREQLCMTKEVLGDSLEHLFASVEDYDKQIRSNLCRNCLNRGEKFARCSGCKLAFYCSSTCQKADWYKVSFVHLFVYSCTAQNVLYCWSHQTTRVEGSFPKEVSCNLFLPLHGRTSTYRVNDLLQIQVNAKWAQILFTQLMVVYSGVAVLDLFAYEMHPSTEQIVHVSQNKSHSEVKSLQDACCEKLFRNPWTLFRYLPTCAFVTLQIE